MTLGFLVMLAGVSRGLLSPQTSPLPVAIATLSGVITQFIGATFLFIYRSTTQQASSYAQTLERINSVGMSWYVLQTMPEDTSNEKLSKNIARSDLLRLIMNQTLSQKANASYVTDEQIGDTQSATAPKSA